MDAGSGGWLNDFRLSLSFLTRLPVATAIPTASTLAASMRAFPLAGALIGLLTGLALAIAWKLGLPAPIAAMLAVAAGLILTGGLHEDGLADAADGLGGGKSLEDALEIMRDSRIGSFGVMALVLAIGLKTAALAALLQSSEGGWPGMAALITAGAWSRAILPAFMHALPPARADGLALLAGTPSRSTAVQAATIAWLIGIVVLSTQSILLGLFGAPIVCLLGGGAVGWIADRRIGGHTGDLLGAAQVVSEAAVLILCAAVLAA